MIPRSIPINKASQSSQREELLYPLGNEGIETLSGLFISHQE